uniref:Terminal oxygenase component of carbazole 1,9a-dioxygenase n=1 Tax=carbazole-degrading bacterium OC13S TaxID=586730 RepID=C4B8G7_UNCXX|nr:terminal oxygenase component of carbazole 1,9a-dioxygenase [carbazole-degrading bacterium OC13S]
MEKTGFVSDEILKKIRVGKDYVAAKYGFRNHWYPALFSKDIGEEEIKTVELLGEKILLKRIDGTVYGIKDQCIHKGVPLSRKPECYTKDTISCWYHGFTFRFDDGLLCDIVGVDQSNIIGKRHVKSYPVQEAKGLVFVFVGDEGFDVPDLSEDVPPKFLDEDMAIRGMAREINSNWRVGAENGFDSTHIFIHKDSILIENNDLALPLGLVPTGRGAFKSQTEEGGPKGVFDLFGPETIRPVFHGTVEGQEVRTGTPDGKNLLPHNISIWLPGVLRVDPWPDPKLTQFEWYVPIDGKRHMYIQTIGCRVQNEEEEARFEKEFEERWRPVALEGFNNDDIWAREAAEDFYADDTGWLREQLFEPDGNIVEWRKMASKYNRGIQKPEDIK